MRLVFFKQILPQLGQICAARLGLALLSSLSLHGIHSLPHLHSPDSTGSKQKLLATTLTSPQAHPESNVCFCSQSWLSARCSSKRCSDPVSPGDPTQVLTSTVSLPFALLRMEGGNTACADHRAHRGGRRGEGGS